MNMCAHCGGWGCVRCGQRDIYIVTGPNDEIQVFSSKEKAKTWVGEKTDLYIIREEAMDP